MQGGHDFAGARRNSEQEEVSVPQGIYLKWIKNQLDDESACLELPLTIILMLSFSLLAVWHLRQDIVFSVEQGIERDILENANFAFSHYFGHKDILDAHSISDFWSWVRVGFLPLVIQPTWAYSERYAEDALAFFNSTAIPNSQHNFGNDQPLPITGDYLHYHRIVGGLRFRQESVPMSEDSCKFPGKVEREAWLQWYGKPCMPATSEIAFLPDTPVAEDFGEPARIEWMFTDLDSLETMLAQSVDMEDGCSQLASKNRTKCLCKWCEEHQLPWLTENTQRVEIQMASYNAEYGLISLTGVNFFFNRGGFIHKRVEIQSSWMDVMSRPWSELVPMFIVDFIWLASLIYITVSELREIVHTIRSGDGRWYQSLRDDYIAFWNIVDWVSILVANVVVVLFSQLLMRTVDLHKGLEDLIEVTPYAGGRSVDRESYALVVMQFYSALEAVCAKEKTLRLVLCIYPVMVMLRLFKSFHAQPRLAMVTETMIQAYQDMMHFSLVFMGVTFCLCLNAVLLFGQDHQEFATFARSLNSCFRMMFGDWDWKPMEEVWRFTAMLWFWLFMTLLVVILLNMLLAIIMDNYMNVKKGSADAITVGGQISSMWRRYKQNKRRERVRLNEILQWFLEDAGGSERAMMKHEREVTPTFLQEHIRGIPLDQAIRTLKNAQNEHAKCTEAEFQIEDAVEPLERIEATSKLSRDGLFYAYDRVDFYDTGEIDQQLQQQQQQPEEEAEVFADRGKLLNADDNAVSDEVIDFVVSEVQRLSSETARVLAQSVKRVDQRQSRIEQRQRDMVDSVREMQAALLNLQSEASALATRLQRVCFEQVQSDQQASAWRMGLNTCTPVTPCLDLSMADAKEGLLPRVRSSPEGKALPAG